MLPPLMRPAVVYKVTLVATQEIYIGVTGSGLRNRRRQHVRDAQKGRLPHSAFANAIRKHGEDAFEWEVLKEFNLGADAVAEEARLIKELRPQLNSTPGGEGFCHRKMSPEARERLSKLHKGNKYFLGMKHKEETKEKLRQIGLSDKSKWLQRSHLGPEASSKPVVCVTTGTVHASASAAAELYGVAKSAVIEMCSGLRRRLTIGGHVFRYDGFVDLSREEALAMREAPRPRNTPGARGVYRHGNKWRAQIGFGGRKSHKRKHLGLFNTLEEAKAAYQAAAIKYKQSA